MKPPSCLIDLQHRALFRLTGPDRLRYLNGQVSNNVALASAERSIPACVCNVKGKLDGHVYITTSSDGEALLIDAPGELREDLFLRLDRYLIADDCELTDVTDEFSLIHAFGETRDYPGAVWRSSNRFGPAGFDLWITAESRDSLFSSESEPPLNEDDPSVESIRIRCGVPKWGAELSADILPAEAGLDRTSVDFHKGCYLGQEVISRIQSVGKVNRTLCLLAIADPGEPIAVGDSLFPLSSDSDSDAKPVGRLTSITSDRRWSLGFVRRPSNTPETKLVSRSTEGRLSGGGLEVRTFESCGE